MIGMALTGCGALDAPGDAPPRSGAPVATQAPATPTATPRITPPAPTPTDVPQPTAYAAVLADFDAPGTLITDTAAPIAMTPELIEALWNIRAAVNPFAGTITELPEPRTDANGRRIIDSVLPIIWQARLVLVLNADGTVRAAAVTTPSGGLDMGEMSPYSVVDLIYVNLAVALTSDVSTNVLDDLGLGASADTGALRVDVDRTTTSGPLRFHFVTTPEQGDWFIATAAQP